MDAQRASIEAQLAALIEQAGPAQAPPAPKPSLPPAGKIRLRDELESLGRMNEYCSPRVPAPKGGSGGDYRITVDWFIFKQTERLAGVKPRKQDTAEKRAADLNAGSASKIRPRIR